MQKESQRHNDKGRAKTSLKIYLSLYCKGSKRFTQGFTVSGSWGPNRNCNILTPLLWPSAWCLSRSQGLINRGPGAHSAGFLYCLLSPTGLVPKLYRGSRGPLRPGVAFPTTSCLRRL